MHRPQHISANSSALQGNDGHGRYVFLPGSRGRAKKISERFSDLSVLTNSRGHDIYLGKLEGDNAAIDVAAVSSGMGVGSLEIIVSELIMLGAKRFIRVGTSGSLQPDVIKVPSTVIATAAVRDEDVSRLYSPIEVPAVSSPEFIVCLQQAALKLGYGESVYLGPVHSKAALYARELQSGPLAHQHREYMELLSQLGILVTEMETSALFILGQYYNKKIRPLSRLFGECDSDSVLMGSILAVVGDELPFSRDQQAIDQAIDQAIAIAIEGVKLHANTISD